jgi:hypothetical protein
MHTKYQRVLMVALFIVFSLTVCAGSVAAKWVPDDEGNLYWWEPPKEPIYQKVKDTPTILDQRMAEVLFMMDTSGSMNDEFDVLCNKIDDIVQGLQDGGITIDYKILGINATRNCASGTVSGSVPNPTVNHIEDWGPAVQDVAEKYSWKPGYVRIAIPMGDEGSQDGNPWNSSDDDAIDRAKEAAKANYVGVIPIIGTPWEQSEYPKIVAGAQELANYCWGEAFLSTDPTDDLVNGIINAINNLYNPIPDKVSVYMYVDDAFADAGVKGYVNKIPGDIAFLVARITNGGNQIFTGDLKITYPSSWNLVGHDEVMRRKKGEPWVEEPCTETVDTSTPGEVIIQNISIPKDDSSTPNENEGKTCEYVVKVIIPTSQIANVCTSVNVEVYPSSGGTSFQTANDSFDVSVNSGGDMIVTNRHLLFERHDDKKKVLDILKEIQKIALKRSAVVFYVDWWDEYDNFSGINPGGVGSNEASTPIKHWDRLTDIDYTSETTANENVCTPIDDYTHYWANQLGGIDSGHHLLIVGNDWVVPFHRTENALPRYGDWWDDGNWYNSTGGFDHTSSYDASSYTEDAASEGFAYSDVIYADTDGADYQDGNVEDMYVSRIVGQDESHLLETLIYCQASREVCNNAIVTLDNQCKPKISDFATDANKTAETIFPDNNYTVNPTNGKSLYKDDTTHGVWDFDDLKQEFKNPFDHFVYHDHGEVDGDCSKFNGSDFDSVIDGTNLSTYFYGWKPNFILRGCLMGQVDRTEGTTNKNLMVYSLFRNYARHILGATTISTGQDLAVDYLERIMDGDSVAQALKSARNSNLVKGCAPVYNLYGLPWIKYPHPTSAFTSASGYSVMIKQEKVPYSYNSNVLSNTIQDVTTKTIQERITDYEYSIVPELGFEFVDINDYERSQELNKLVVPVREYKIPLPRDTQINSISVNRSNSVSLGSLNIPIKNGAPPMPGTSYQEYLDAPDSIGLFDTSHSYYTYTDPNNKILVLRIYPVRHDTPTNDTLLYKDVDIQITYETSNKGVLIKASPEKQNYSSGETINVDISIENIIDQSTQFDISVELNDRLQNTVQTQKSSITIDPAHLGQATVQLQAPSKGGSYWVETSVNDGVQEIGTSSEHINVNPGRITYIDVPRCIPGGTADFKVTFHNSSDTDVEAAIDLLIYQDSTPVAEFIPVVYTVLVDNNQDAIFTWDIPSDFPGGDYLAVATVTCDEYTSSLSKSFAIGGKSLDRGWNLISLCKQPLNNTIPIPIDPIIGKYSSLWAFQNNSWKVYDPDHQGFSDLDTMEAGWGYWINMMEAATLMVAGTDPSSFIDLIRGWNLVGYNSCTSQSIASALASIEGKYISVWAYINGQWRVYDPANPGFSDLITMEPGYGYWIKTKQNCTWTLP